VRPSGETLRFTCAEHAPGWASRIRGRYLVLERDEWEAQGQGIPWRDAGRLGKRPRTRPAVGAGSILR